MMNYGDKCLNLKKDGGTMLYNIMVSQIYNCFHVTPKKGEYETNLMKAGVHKGEPV